MNELKHAVTWKYFFFLIFNLQWLDWSLNCGGIFCGYEAVSMTMTMTIRSRMKGSTFVKYVWHIRVLQKFFLIQ